MSSDGTEPSEPLPDGPVPPGADEDRLDESHAAAALTSPLEDLPPLELPPLELDAPAPEEPDDVRLVASAPDVAVFDGSVPDEQADEEGRRDAGNGARADGTEEQPDPQERPADAVPTATPDGTEDETGVLEPAAPAVDAAAERDEPRSDGWVALARAMRPRATRAQVLTGILCAVLGFALVTQVRQASGDNLGSLRQDELVRILDETTARGEALQEEAADLRAERDELLSGSDRRQAALEALERSAANQGILTGRLPATGRGVVVTLSDVDRALSPVVLLDVLEELRNAGAEAIELNNLRITASSAFSGEAGAVLLDGEPVTSPYLWRVIGDPDAIAPALQIPGGAFAQVRNSGGAASVERADTVEITSTRVLPEPRYAVVEEPADG